MTSDKIRELISRPGGYRLSDGVYATVGGIVFDFFEQMPLYEYCYGEKDEYTHDDFGSNRVWLWPDAAERLRYRDGESFIIEREYGCPYGEYETVWVPMPGVLHNEPGWKWGPSIKVLHRLAAILCDDADAFRVLHWCVHNLGGNS